MLDYTEMSDAGSEDDDGKENGDGFESESLSRLLQAVADQRRRTILYTLKASDADVSSLDELADKIAPQDSQFGDPQKVRLVLHHKDLPKLADLGLLDYDSRNETVRYRSDHAIEEFLEVLRDLEK